MSAWTPKSISSVSELVQNYYIDEHMFCLHGQNGTDLHLQKMQFPTWKLTSSNLLTLDRLDLCPDRTYLTLTHSHNFSFQFGCQMVKNKGHIIWFTTLNHKNLQIYTLLSWWLFLKGLFKKFRITQWTCQATTSCKRCKNRFNSAVETTLAPAFPLTLRRSSSRESSWYSCADFGLIFF